MHINKLYGLLFGLVLAVQSVFAYDFLTAIFSPFDGVDFGATYQSFYSFIDFFVYFAFFLALAKLALSYKFKGRAGNAIYVVLGLMFAIALTVWESSTGFNIGSLWPVAAFLFLLLFAFLSYYLIHSFTGKNLCSFAIAYLFFYSMYRMIVSELYSALPDFIKAILAVFLLVALVALILCISSYWQKLSKATDVPDDRNNGGNGGGNNNGNNNRNNGNGGNDDGGNDDGDNDNDNYDGVGNDDRDWRANITGNLQDGFTVRFD